MSISTRKQCATILLAKLIISFCVSCCYAAIQDRVQLSSNPDITITGEPHNTTSIDPVNPSKFVYAYYGIRYGTANRFEAAVENTDFSYLQNTSRPKLGPVCPQRPSPPQMGPDAHLVQSEDCLYLDVYVPSTVPGSESPLPVMMWIYAGVLQVGQKDGYNATDLASAIGAIIVTINYRLSVFGFLSTEDRVAPGNYGLGDCKLALQWIKRHIGRFGGDPCGITIFGQSAGAYLVSAMLLDAQVRDSIRASISFSESVLTDSIMGYFPDAKKSATDLGVAVNCPVTTSDDLISCLKRLPVQTLLAAAKGFDSGNPNIGPYGLVIDGVQLMDEPLKAVEAAARLAASGPNITIGYLREDMSGILPVTNPELFDPNTTLTIAHVKDIIAREFLTRGYTSICSIPNYDLAQMVMDHYNFSNDDDRSARLLKLFHVGTDSVFTYPGVKEARLYAANRRGSNATTQLYRISHDPGYNGQVEQYLDGKIISVIHTVRTSVSVAPYACSAYEASKQLYIYRAVGAFHGYDMANVFFPSQQLPGLTLNQKVMDNLRFLVRQVAHQYPPIFASDLRDDRYMELGHSGHWESAIFDQQPIVDFWDNITALNKAYNLKCANEQPY